MNPDTNGAGGETTSLGLLITGVSTEEEGGAPAPTQHVAQALQDVLLCLASP
jgi:hypothetical protein